MNRQDAKAEGFPEPKAELDQMVRGVIGACIEVHRALGPGFLESVYERAVALELAHRRIPFQRQVPVALQYRGEPIGDCKIDLLVGGRLVVELKAVERFADIHVAQVIAYLRALRQPLGLLINFHVPLLGEAGIKRVVLAPD